MSPGKNFGMVASAVTLMLVSSCLFDTRDAQPPATGTTACTLETYDRPLLCMQKAIESRQSADYENSISETFFFTPTAKDLNDENFAGVPVYENWDKKVEMQVFNSLIGDSKHLDVDFGTPSPLINETTYVRLSVTYKLDVVTNAAPTDTTRYEGITWIDVKNEGGNWRVTSWQEQQEVPGGNRTWGFLRGIIRLPLVP